MDSFRYILYVYKRTILRASGREKDKKTRCGSARRSNGTTGGSKNIVWDTNQNGTLDSDGKTELGFYNRTRLAIRSDASIVARMHSQNDHLWTSNSGILKATSMQWTQISNIKDTIEGHATMTIPGMNPYVAVYMWRRTA